MYCTNCGTPIEPSDTFCGKCGGRMASPMQPPSQIAQKQVLPYPQMAAPMQPKKRGLGFGLWLLIVVTVAVIVVVAVVSSTVDKTSTPTAPEQVVTQTSDTAFSEIGYFRSDAMRGFSLYVTNPTRASITEKCAQMKKQYIDDETSKKALDIDFFDNEAQTPNFTGPEGYYFPDECEPYHVAAYFFNPFNGESRLDFVKAIPE